MENQLHHSAFTTFESEIESVLYRVQRGSVSFTAVRELREKADFVARIFSESSVMWARFRALWDAIGDCYRFACHADMADSASRSSLVSKLQKLVEIVCCWRLQASQLREAF
ncbi:hypothetical protein [Methylomonas sp. DH-1]|uniref:hypothetical protein n=1 Tax=Methylomonas sp. (strain DH-1) TaxID=1727196 RepID=UPI0007C89C32|nr:hypothetical protein [Methylomonas sp. DH-1]ANE57477.1 hypothetical protein AYM39_21345 [Methylomonas sp. DH-1]